MQTPCILLDIYPSFLLVAVRIYKRQHILVVPMIQFQKPLMLHGHERSITQIKYNREGDLLFSSAKDPQPNVWYSLNGERLGTFRGHTGAVWCIDVNCILWAFHFLLIGLHFPPHFNFGKSKQKKNSKVA